jgi:isoamylase
MLFSEPFVPKRVFLYNKMTMLKLTDGSPHSLGAVPDGAGVNFALFSKNATKVELCLFNADGSQEFERIELPKRTGDVWHGHVAGLKPGQIYGYRVSGPFDPQNGHRFDSQKLLLDPYARETVGEFVWTPEQAAFGADNAAVAVKGRVTEPLPKSTVSQPGTSWSDTVIYEMHVKGFTKADDRLPEPARHLPRSCGAVVRRLSERGRLYRR